MMITKRPIRLEIPDGLEFSELKMERTEKGQVAFNWEVIKEICAYNGASIDIFEKGPEINVASLIVSWYMQCRDKGMARDEVIEGFIREMFDGIVFNAWLDENTKDKA